MEPELISGGTKDLILGIKKKEKKTMRREKQTTIVSSTCCNVHVITKSKGSGLTHNELDDVG